jgi:hypothetical protein
MRCFSLERGRNWTRFHTLVMDEIDIWRMADLLVKDYGDEAVFLASQRADASLDQGDTDGFTAWLKVVKAIETLQRKGPPEGEALN